MVRILDGTDPGGRPAHLEAVSTTVRRGGVALVPDEGVYSLICDAFSRPAVARVRELKGRSGSPLTVLVGYHSTVDGIAARIPGYAQDLMAALWPGPLTLILRQQPSLAWALQAPGVAVRMPLHPVLLSVVRDVGPTAATSANAAGYPPVHDVPAALAQLDDRVGIAFDAGPVPLAERSTVIDATGTEPSIVRQGAFDADRIAQICPGLEVRPE
jgi:L-threonylcarbamoyladenylate synthase